jgi:hypothetical protein
MKDDAAPALRLDEAKQFLGAIAPGEDSFTFQTFDDSDKSTTATASPPATAI